MEKTVIPIIIALLVFIAISPLIIQKNDLDETEPLASSSGKFGERQGEDPECPDKTITDSEVLNLGKGAGQGLGTSEDDCIDDALSEAEQDTTDNIEMLCKNVAPIPRTSGYKCVFTGYDGGDLPEGWDEKDDPRDNSDPKKYIFVSIHRMNIEGKEGFTCVVVTPTPDPFTCHFEKQRIGVRGL